MLTDEKRAELAIEGLRSTLAAFDTLLAAYDSSTSALDQICTRFNLPPNKEFEEALLVGTSFGHNVRRLLQRLEAE